MGQHGGTFLPVAVNKCSIIPSRLPRMPSADQLITMCSAASTYSHMQQLHKSHISRRICNIKPESSLLPPHPPFDQIRSVPISRTGTSLVTVPSSYDGMHAILICDHWHSPDRCGSVAWHSQHWHSALCCLFGDVQSSLKCSGNGSLILHPCDVTAHLTNIIKRTCFCFSLCLRHHVELFYTSASRLPWYWPVRFITGGFFIVCNWKTVPRH